MPLHKLPMIYMLSISEGIIHRDNSCESCFFDMNFSQKLIKYFRYGQNQSQPHGKCLSLCNKRTHELNLKSGQRIREILVFRSFDQKYVTGLQFKVNGRATEIYGSESRRVQPLRSLYNSDLVYCQYFNGKSNLFMDSIVPRDISKNCVKQILKL